jgi:hypothetical protein
MTQDEFLKRIGLTHEEFVDLVRKFNKFARSLSKTQMMAVEGSMLPLSDAARTFDPDLSENDFADIVDAMVKTVKPTPVMFIHWGAIFNPNPDPDPNSGDSIEDVKKTTKKSGPPKSKTAIKQPKPKREKS